MSFSFSHKRLLSYLHLSKSIKPILAYGSWARAEVEHLIIHSHIKAGCIKLVLRYNRLRYVDGAWSLNKRRKEERGNEDEEEGENKALLYR